MGRYLLVIVFAMGLFAALALAWHGSENWRRERRIRRRKRHRRHSR